MNQLSNYELEAHVQEIARDCREIVDRARFEKLIYFRTWKRRKLLGEREKKSVKFNFLNENFQLVTLNQRENNEKSHERLGF